MTDFACITALTKIMKIPSTKNQIPNKSQLPKFKNPNKRSVFHFAQRHDPRLSIVYKALRYYCGECFGHWILKFEIYLEFGA